VPGDIGTPPIDGLYSFMIQVEREADLALMDFFFYNFSVGDDRAGNRAILPNDDGCLLLVRFPPQAIGEAEYLFSDVPAAPGNGNVTELPFDPPPILSALSGPSQIAFIFNASTGDEIPFIQGNEQDLLDWSNWNLSVPPVAEVQPRGPGVGYPTPQAPGSFDTYIEFPYALFLAPTLWVGGDVLTRFDTVFENNIVPLSSTASITDLFACGIVQRPFFQLVDQGSDYTPNQLDQPLGFAALWCDDFTMGDGYTDTYNINDDVTLWQYIEYGVPLT